MSARPRPARASSAKLPANAAPQPVPAFSARQSSKAAETTLLGAAHPDAPRGSRQAPHSKAGAFSLVELVIVIVIIGVIAAIAVPRFSAARDSAARSQTENSVYGIQSALQLYISEHTPFASLDDAVTKLNAGVLAKRTNEDHSDTGTPTLGPYLGTSPTNMLLASCNRGWVKWVDSGSFAATVTGDCSGGPLHGWALKQENNEYVVGYIESANSAKFPPY